IRRLWPATLSQLSPATNWALPVGQTGRLSRSLWTAPVRSASGLFARASSWQERISAERGAGWRRCLPAFQPRTAKRFTGTLLLAGAEFEETQTIRRELVRRVVALDPVIDEAFGESSQLRYHSPVLQNAVDGLFAALAAWRTTAVLLARSPEQRARREADAVLAEVPEPLRARPQQDEASRWMADPTRLLQ